MTATASIRAEFEFGRLSEGQRTVLIHRTLGRDLKTISRLTPYTIETVKTYIRDAKACLHARNCAEACWLAQFCGQISAADILREYSREQADD